MSKSMESIHEVSVAVAALVCGCGLVFVILKRVNEWVYVNSLGQQRAALLPPGNMGWPLVGQMWTFFRAFASGRPDSFLDSFVSRYGATGIYKTYMFGSPIIIVCKPETCRRVLMDDQNFKLGYPKAVTILTGRRSLHNISNAEHKRLRRLTAAPLNGSQALSMYISGIEQTIVASLEEWSGSERPVEFLTGLQKVTFKIIASIFFGLDQVDFNFKPMEILYGDLASGMKSMAVDLPGFTFHRGVKARKELVKILRSIVDERKALKAKNGWIMKKNMLDMLMEAEDEDKRKLEEEDIIDILLVFMLAGQETSAHGTMWAALYLQEHPDILQKAKEEQEEIISKRPATQDGLTLKEIKQSQYLSRNNKAKAGAFVPFGAGSRFCAGSDLVKLEMSVFLHQFLLHYKLERVNPNSPVLYIPMPHPSDKCLVRFEKLH